jgi:cellulose synthase operon protein C
MRARGCARILAGFLGLLSSVSALADGPGPYAPELSDAVAELRDTASQPSAIGSLTRVMSLVGKVPDASIEGILRQVADDPLSHPLVAAQASFEMARFDELFGRDTEAAQRYRALGLIESFWVLGPFEGQARGEVNPTLPSETQHIAPAEGRAFPGKLPGQTVAWRRIPTMAQEGAFVVDAVLRPDSEALALLMTHVQSEKATSVALRLGTSGPWKVWCNGRMVGQSTAERSAHLDQETLGLRLDRGDNQIVIRTSVREGAWRVFARLTALDGRPVRGVQPSIDGKRNTDLTDKAAPLVPRLVDLKTLLEQSLARADLGKDEDVKRRARMDLASFHFLIHPDDIESKTVETVLQLVDAAPSKDASPEEALLFARVSSKPDQVKPVLRRALATGPRPHLLCLLRHELGQQIRREGNEGADSEARALLVETLAADSTCWPATLAQAQLYRDAGFPLQAHNLVEALSDRYPDVPMLQRERLSGLDSTLRTREGDALALQLWNKTPGDYELRDRLVSSARAARDADGVMTHLQWTATRHKALLHRTLDLAEWIEASGDPARAIALLDATALRLPDDPTLQIRLGEHRARAHDVAGTIAAWERALALRPQNPELRRALERMRFDNATASAVETLDLSLTYAIDANPIARDAIEHPKADGAPSEILAERRVVRVHPNGLSEVFAQRVVHVRTESAARDNQEFMVRYVPGEQEVDVHVARVYRRGLSGAIEILSATGRDDRDLSEPWYGLYYDNRADVVMFEDLRAGDVVELQYSLSDVAYHNEMADYFGDLNFVADTVAKRSWEYFLLVPSSRPIYFHVPTLPGFRHETESQAGITVHRFIARDVPRLEAESLMPGWTEVAPYVHVSTYKNWEAVGAWYWKLVSDQLVPDELVRKAAHNAVVDLTEAVDKVKAIHAFVIKATRYVGLEFGIHGYKPYRVSQILARRFGDCKDKASLIVAMLGELGIDAELVLLRTRRGGRIETEPASLAIFDHAIAYVPSLDLYLDGTAEFSGTAELPYQDQGVTALHVNARGARLVQTPVLPAANNRVARRWIATLDSQGGAKVEEEVRLAGQSAPEWRKHYQTEGEQLEKFQKAWRERNPGATVQSLAMAGTSDPNAEVKTISTVEVPSLAVLRNDSLEVPVVARDAHYLRSYARSAARDHELVLAYPWQHDETLEYHFPDGWEISRLPLPRAVKTDFGVFELKVVSDPEKRLVRVETHLEVSQHRYPKDVYPAFRSFLSSIDQILSDVVVLRPRAEVEK